MTNLERAGRGLAALTIWKGTGKPDEADLSDLLADLMHLARLSRCTSKPLLEMLGSYEHVVATQTTGGWNWDHELNRAETNFEAERQAPNWQSEFSGI